MYFWFSIRSIYLSRTPTFEGRSVKLWVGILTFLFYAAERRMQYSVYIMQKKDHLFQSRKKQGSHLARSKLTNKISLFEPGSASLSKFEFEPKGSEISSSWRRVRVNYEPSSTVVETISPKNKHFSCNICAIIFYLLYTATAGYLAHFVHNASYAFLCAMEIKPQNNIFLSNKYTFQTIIQNVTNT